MATNKLVISKRNHQLQQDFIEAIIDKTTSQTLEYCHLSKMAKYQDIWHRSFANKLGHLAQGIRNIKGTNTIQFIQHTVMPTNKMQHMDALSARTGHKKRSSIKHN
jgi:hypothetical protein